MMNTGAKVALVCTGSVCSNKDEIDKSVDYLRSRYQLNCVYDKSCYQWQPADRRADIFLHYLQDPTIDMIWSLRGGEGTADILPYLHQHRALLKTLSPKPVLGFSDFTAMLFYLSQHYQWPVIHGHGALQLPNAQVNPLSEDYTMNLLFGQAKNMIFADLVPLNAGQSVIGPAIAGNLTLLTLSVKDLFEINCDNKILFIEDVNEKPHAIHRSLKYLKRIGLFNGLRALVCGDFSCANDKEDATLNVLTYFASECDFPVFKSHLFGHGRHNLPIVFDQAVMIEKQDEHYFATVEFK